MSSLQPPLRLPRSSGPRTTRRGDRLTNRGVVLVLVAACGTVLGAAAGRPGSAGIALALVLAGFFTLLLLGPRSSPWAMVVVAVVPWYPFLSAEAGPPLVSQKILCGALAAAVVVPWLWNARTGISRRSATRASALYGVLALGLTVLIYYTVGSVQVMISTTTVGVLLMGLAFAVGRRFNDPRAWSAAAAAGLIALVAMGLAAAASSPGLRIGGFTGYPITYGALLVGLLPAGLTWTARRSRAGALVLGAAAGAALILCQSRSSWIASVVMLAVLVALLIRQRQTRALRAVAVLMAVIGVAITSTGSLHGIIERKLSSNQRQTDSVTHRSWSVGYALKEIRNHPLAGAGAPGYSAQQSAKQTNIGAIDNGYLSITVDTGVLGLIAVTVPIGVALVAIVRWVRRRSRPEPELVALALGIIGMATVAAFYDAFYWAQIAVLLAAAGGVVAAGLGRADQPSPTPRPTKGRRGLVPFLLGVE